MSLEIHTKHGPINISMKCGRTVNINEEVRIYIAKNGISKNVVWIAYKTPSDYQIVREKYPI